MRKYLPEKELFLGKTIENHVIQEYVGSGNNGLVFRAFNESTNSTHAFKIVPKDNLAGQYLEEARKANVLENSSVVRCHGVVEYSDSNVDCVVFIYDYVKGESLKDYIKHDQSNIDLHFIESFLETMLGLLHELKERRYQHGDLHAGNVLVAKSEFDIRERTTFRVTDFGVRELTGATAHASDYLHIADTLRQLLERVEYRDCEGEARYIYTISARFCGTAFN